MTNSGSNTVTKIKANDGRLVGTYTVGANPDGICFDGASIWTANQGSSDVTKLKASDGSFIGTYIVAPGPTGLCFDGANIWVASGVSGVSNCVTKL